MFWGETSPVDREGDSLKGRVDVCTVGLEEGGTEVKRAR